MHNGVAQKTKRLQGQSNLNAWEEPRDTHDQTQTNKTRTNQTPNTQEQKNIKKQAPTPPKHTRTTKPKPPKHQYHIHIYPVPRHISPNPKQPIF
ncbi:MAG: hypothetical protein CMC15_18845 [Flavobacteriaceae bacterium]|nr:hypothetical protein [Flavobacteriaceae bacterium]